MKPFIKEHLEQLIGFTITEIGEDVAEDERDRMQTLTLEKDGGPGEYFKLTVYVSQDEEGNGPGHLFIE